MIWPLPDAVPSTSVRFSTVGATESTGGFALTTVSETGTAMLTCSSRGDGHGTGIVPGRETAGIDCHPYRAWRHESATRHGARVTTESQLPVLDAVAVNVPPKAR